MTGIDIHDKLIPITCLGIMLIGVLMPILNPDNRRIKRKSAIVFVLGATVLLGNWLLQEPDILITLRRNIGWVLLGLVITFIKILKR